MATFTSVFLTVTILVAAGSAAPNKKLRLKIPDECRGKGFCAIKPEGYDELQKMLDRLLTHKFIAQNIGDRIGDSKPTEELSPENDWHNCPYRRTTEESVYAYSSTNDSDPDIIIQHNLLKQPIDIVQCANDKIETGSSQECFQHLGLSSFNMQSRCQSSTAKRSLYVYDFKLGGLAEKSYDVPCCCSCIITKNV